MHVHSLSRSLALALLLALLPLAQVGCSALGFGGAMIDSYRRSSTRTIEPQYNGLKDKSWAVLVSADRMIQGEYPDLVLYLSSQISDRIGKANGTVGASGYVPPERLIAYLYEHPDWVTKPRGVLAKEIGVDRLIVVEVLEYRLNEPGNAYVWAGVATGSVGVIDTSSASPDEFVFEKPVRVSYPDNKGTTQAEVSMQVINSVLAGRFADRAAWLFFRHEEPYYPKY